MSKIAEKKAKDIAKKLEASQAYKFDNFSVICGAIEGYDQAMQDMVKDSDHFGYLSDEVGYAYACGCRKTMQDFLEKAERYLNYTLYSRVEIEVYGTLIPSIVNKKEFIDNFKKYMQDESEN